MAENENENGSWRKYQPPAKCYSKEVVESLFDDNRRGEMEVIGCLVSDR